MERKTIGGLIAALRKANGMTQKDLAERLHVSDKSVSRWERDDGAPDLSLIPVIAEIFDVTCDELLRGERKSAAERTDPETTEEYTTPKGEKERKRLMKVSLSQFKSRSIVAAGITLAGLIAAMVGNFALTRAYLGFLIGTVFYLAAAVCQAVFTNGALLAVSDESMSEVELGEYRRKVLFWTETVGGITLCLLAASLPLALMTHDPHVGLSWGAWTEGAAVFGAIAAALVLLTVYFLNAALLKRGLYVRKDAVRYWYNHRLKRNCTLLLLGLYAATFLGHYAATAGFNPYHLAEGIEFTDYESFRDYMAQPIPYSRDPYYISTEPTDTPVASEQVDEPVYYNEFGVQITEEEARTREVRNGKDEVVCTYLDYNENVAAIRWGGGETMLPIRVVTFDEMREARAEIKWRSVWFGIGYGLELIAVAALYVIKRKR